MPDEITVRLWLAHILRCENNQIFNVEHGCLVLDGIPRNLNQALLLAIFKSFFNFNAHQEMELRRRIKGRALKESRHDDAQDEVILRRLEVYEMESQPLLAYFPASRVHHIDGIQSPPAILDEIAKIIIQESPCPAT